MDDRARRIGENEALYRSVNERIEGMNAAFGVLTGSMAVICECGYLECSQQLELDVSTYERVRAEPTHFVVVPGHEIPAVESIVEQHETFLIIRKDTGEPAKLARETDPRS